ncbi:MAG: hypothetical protein AAGF12_17935 [Myxococcota bacterium]
MADLEKHAFRRDKRFLVRLALLLAAGAVLGVVLMAALTSSDVSTCAAESFGASAAPSP